MTETELRQFLEGLLVAWRTDAAIETAREAADVVAWVRPRAGAVVEVRRGVRAIGVVWEVAAGGGRPRPHPSAQGAIRSLGAALAPERSMARVMFAGGMAGQDAGLKAQTP